MMGGRRSAMEQTDWHALAEQAFAGAVTARVDEICRNEQVNALIVIAPRRPSQTSEPLFPSASGS